MRLAEHKIKEAILHADLELRARAISYFAKSYSADASVMPLVIESLEKYGREDAWQVIGSMRDLRQTEATITWVIGELNDDRSNDFESYVYNLTMLLVQADPALLLPFESAIREAKHLPAADWLAIEDRLRMLAWDEARCWQELHDFCEAYDSEAKTNQRDGNHCRRIVEALARFGEASEAKVLEILSQDIDESVPNNPMFVLEESAVQLAGEARLQAAVPLLISKLSADIGDILNERCATALIRIGTPAVVEAIAAAFPSAPRHFRIYATGSLENIHCDLAVEKCLALLEQEQHESARCNLAHAALWQFAPEAIVPARKLLIGQEIDFESRDVRNCLIQTCTLMGLRFPEYDQWLAEDRAENKERNRRLAECQDEPLKLLQYAFENLTGKKLPDIPLPRPTELARVSQPSRIPMAPAPLSTDSMLLDSLPRTIPGSNRRVGRNEPCPCGSGRKYKQCCLRKADG
jgi:hypothetical protein